MDTFCEASASALEAKDTGAPPLARFRIDGMVSPTLASFRANLKLAGLSTVINQCVF